MINRLILILGLFMSYILVNLPEPRSTVHRIKVGTSLGSGVSIASIDNRTLVLTAFHVIQDGGPCTINGKPAKIIAHDKIWDLAVIVIDETLPVSKLSNHKPEIGDQLTVCGYGSGIYAENTGKVVQFFSPGYAPNDFIAIDAIARSGDSGGPLFYSDGEVGAILFGSDNLGAHGAHCIRVRVFLSTITGYEKLINKALGEEYILYEPKGMD